MGLRKVYKIVNVKTGRIVKTCPTKIVCKRALETKKYSGYYPGGMKRYDLFSNIKWIKRRK